MPVTKEARKSKGLSQGDLGLLVSLHRTAITNIELGNQGTTIETLAALCEALDTDPNSLLADMVPVANRETEIRAKAIADVKKQLIAFVLNASCKFLDEELQ